MKKLFLVLVLAFAGIFTANAQVWMGGSTSVYASKNITTFSIAPEVGYCIPNTKWTVAAGVTYGLRDVKVFGDTHNTTHTLIFSPYVRYSIMDIEKFSMFLDLTGDLDLLSKGENFGYRIALQPGIAWMATEHWTAAFRFALLGYNHCDYYLNESEPEYGFKFGFAAAAPSFGLYYNF